MAESDWLRWRSWPDPVLLERLADEVYSIHYLESGSQRGKAIEKIQSENPNLDLPEDEDLGNWVRPWRAGDPEGKATPMKAIRIDSWRISYDAKENKLITEPLGESIERGQWGD